MIDARWDHDAFAEVELLLRAARDYVQPSDELRPRLLEAARSHCAQLRVVGVLRRAAMAVLLLGAVAFQGGHWQASSSPHGPRLIAWALQTRPLTAAALPAAEPRQDWDAVESLTELRRRQAELLRAAANTGRRA